jgi:hypothetical protein
VKTTLAQASDTGGKTHLAEEFVIVREYALDQLESKRLVEVLEL